MVIQRVADLPAGEDFVLTHPISSLRVRRFLDDYLAERGRTQTMERLFERVGAFQAEHLPPPVHVNSFGFKAIVFKGSFVDRSNWLSVGARPFATVQEERLLHQVEETLRSTASGRLLSDVERDFVAIHDALIDMAEELQMRGYDPSLLVVTGQLALLWRHAVRGAK